ncbi:MAG: hypothetical protein CL674_15935 [Bdellovibrionaceae bacterium]|nr:hypothetical protein [Pseudobdellovibrionaceae bacterium]|tara:strand:- start:10588 stop:10872 length:285 start_codon:yes stop_codon:yes gene_type:complete
MNQSNFSTPSAKDLNKMDQEISALKERAKISKIKAQESFETQVRAVEDQFDLVSKKVDRLGQKADMASGEMKRGLSEAWGKLRDSFNKASQYLH